MPLNQIVDDEDDILYPEEGVVVAFNQKKNILGDTTASKFYQERGITHVDPLKETSEIAIIEKSQIVFVDRGNKIIYKTNYNSASLAKRLQLAYKETRNEDYVLFWRTYLKS